MNNIVLSIIAFFFLIGAVDYLEGGKLKLSTYFEEGIKTMGSLAISMIGILSLTPFLTHVLTKFLIPIAQKLSLDASIFPASLIAIDMGGFNLSSELALSNSMGNFSGILMSSILGCTISFTLPLAVGLLKEELMETVFKGILCGIITMPIGLFIGGIMLKVQVYALIYNLLPVIVLAIILTLGIIFRPKKLIVIFRYLGKMIMFVSIIGLTIQGVYSISGIKLLNDIMPIEEVITIVGRIAMFLGGAYVMLEVIKRLLIKPLSKVSRFFDINLNSIAALIGSLASAIVIFSNFDKLDDRGKIICTAFSVGGAYVLGGQMGYVSSVAPEVLSIYIFVKLLCGILAVLFALTYLKYEQKYKK
ncbi:MULTISPECIES: ethanolamine utilization protein EutH [Clostridium]|uniref:ethanolamine utilization protein EutH n=1 Tax=Clostridium TaxID=1485 RepID=UPI000371759E|nr:MULTISPECIES: ethanolamine utilization protein EutH [Clostridium]MBN1034319.1 ethanolamine utilization protein EutH [Clostridium botulinum]MBN1057345.1 ethanolamine utilization protein EutH [Clostridium botulinum]MBN1060591.1 ethanolamine utilization protein EutH [Clostridium botulinum]MBN1063718.1 ethanolamine utilization protein EutH [Clostridium botulinum]MBY6930631.1 ethanolamine utilization protein EutH [Clostridium botulinum]